MPFFKDFNKDVKDLLTKNYAENGAWKIESKAKAPEQTVFFNPSATHKGVTVDVEYNYKPFKTKTTVTEKGNVTPKVTWEDKHNKVEASVDKELKFEVVYEGKFGDITVHDKVTNHAADAYVSYALSALGLGVGGGAAFSIEKQSLKGWSAGVHYSKNGIVADVVTDSLKTYTTGVLFPLTIPGPIPKITVAAQTICGPSTKSLHWAVGVEGGCPLCEGAKFRVKIDQGMKLSLAWFKKFGDNWKIAIGAEPLEKKVGFTFTRE